MVELITFAQGLPWGAKFGLTAVILCAAAIFIVILWQKPLPRETAGGRINQQTTATQISQNGNVNNVGNNSGVIAGSYVAPSPAQEELARQQLADLRERRAQDRRDKEASFAQAEREAREKARLEENRRAEALVGRLRGEYLASHDGISSAMLAGTEPVPDDWMNNRLRTLNVHYIYRGHSDGSFTLMPSS